MTTNILKVQPIALPLIISLLLSILIIPAFAMPNPAAVYCEALGYEYDNGLCILPNNQAVDAWEFLAGKVALEWSYCAKEGYEAKHVEDSEVCKYCAVCVLPDGTEVEVTKLMGLDFRATTCGDGICRMPENFKTCPKDCPSGEWDDYCDGAKDDKCDPDCEQDADPDCEEDKICGNDICDANENYSNCPQDCRSGEKDNYCDGVKDGKCDPDCSEDEDIDCKARIEAEPFLGFDTNLLLITACVIILILIIIIFIVSTTT